MHIQLESEVAKAKRLSVLDENVRVLIDRALAPLVAQIGSVNAATDVLNEALKSAGVQTVIYPNRLHALLAEDPARGLNKSSVDLISRAASLLAPDALRATDENQGRIDQLANEALSHFGNSDRTVKALYGVATAIRLPPAVVRYLLAQRGEQIAVRPPSSISARLLFKSGRNHPDWSFQDDAVRIAVAKLSSSPDRRIAVVVPTGGGKTTIGLRIGLELLAKDTSKEQRVLWVTHRLGLKRQAHRSLQRLLNADERLPEKPSLLAERIDFIMVSQIEQRLADLNRPPALVIVDEAHHAAAASYDPLFESGDDIPVLGLTATPRRADMQPIRVDHIAYQITYRELAERGVVLKPVFREFPVANFDWTRDATQELVDDLLLGADGDYVKTLVIAPRIDRVQEFYDMVLERLAYEREANGHILDFDDVGFIHSESNSLGVSAEEFLDVFAHKPRGIIVSAQMLLEGFDDPSINTVVITYPSSSVVLLMQAAGRCVRYQADKTNAFVVQAHDDLAYYFDQRWLYQEISDVLRPDLTDVSYSSMAELEKKVAEVLENHHVKSPQVERILGEIRHTSAGATCRLMLAGLPFSGSDDSFKENAEWAAILETPKTSEQLRALFNGFSEEEPDRDPQAFLAECGPEVGVPRNLDSGSEWRAYSTLLASMVNARREINGGAVAAVQTGRRYKRNGPTTWLRYVTFNFVPRPTSALADFLADCHNRNEVMELVLASDDRFALLIKIPVPLGGFEAHPLSAETSSTLMRWLDDVREALRPVDVRERFGVFAAQLETSASLGLPCRVMQRIETLLPTEQSALYTLELTPVTSEPSTIDSELLKQRSIHG